MISTSFKLQVATALHAGVTRILSAFGASPQDMRVRRRGIEWQLDLNEGIDFSIYLLGAFEPTTIAAYRQFLKPGSVALDIGANIGAHTLHLASFVGDTGRVIAFEPTSASFKKLSTNLNLNASLAARTTTHQAMLTKSDDDEAPGEIYASWPLASDEELHPHHKGALLSTDGVITTTLDSAIEREGIERIDLIKMDVDGFEEDVLSGAQKVLSHYRPPIVMELAAYTAIEHDFDFRRPTEILLGHGYQFFTLKRSPIDVKSVLETTVQPGHSVNVLAIHPENDTSF